jgi:hypothetical protein
MGRPKRRSRVGHVSPIHKSRIPPPHPKMKVDARRLNDILGIKQTKEPAWPPSREWPPALSHAAMKSKHTPTNEAPARGDGPPQQICGDGATTTIATTTTITTAATTTAGAGGSPSASSSPPSSPPSFPLMDLPPELRDMVWRAALPGPRTVKVLVYAFPGLKLAPLDAGALRLPVAHVCAEARRAVREAGYMLAFRDDDDPNDPGVWFNPRVDVLDRTIWGRGESWDAEP